ncbi:hypothetical protein NCCP2222_20790 [Sporosarcina sp. NCCP-2222]|nr:hypothetical protein NCCP2222_20790 [Sporosarcina sp. NCCP-2222]
MVRKKGFTIVPLEEIRVGTDKKLAYDTKARSGSRGELFFMERTTHGEVIG